MHPIVRSRSRFTLPTNPAAIKEVDIPRLTLQPQRLSEQLHRPTAFIPVVLGSLVGHQAGCHGHIRFGCPPHGHPYHKTAQLGCWLLCKDRLLDSERPSETVPSRRGDQHDDAYGRGLRIEGRAELSSIATQRKMRAIGTPRLTGQQRTSEYRSQHCTAYHGSA